VKHPVISVTKMMPVTRSTHDRGEERGDADYGKGCWAFSQVGEPGGEKFSQDKTALSPKEPAE
jgi:hypothetical protein